MQADSIATLNRWYVIRLDSIWRPTVRQWAAMPDHFDRDDVYRRYRRAREASVDLLVALAVLPNGFTVQTPPRIALDLPGVSNALGKSNGLRPEIVARFREGDIRHCYADITAIQDALGYRPRVSISEGIPDLIEWASRQTVADRVRTAVSELEERSLIR